jgi:hypothetical protein
VRIRKPHPLLSEAVEVRRREVVRWIECMNITYSKVVSQNYHDVGRPVFDSEDSRAPKDDKQDAYSVSTA